MTAGLLVSALAGCAPSSVYVDAASIELGTLPASVYAEAGRRVSISPARLTSCAETIGKTKAVGAVTAADVERCQLNKAEAKRLIAALVRSEARKIDALKAAISSHERNRARLRKRGKKGGKA